MEELNRASEIANRLTDRDVRILYLPPMTLAAVHTVGQGGDGEHAEGATARVLDGFIEKARLREVYPAARVFGFNNPDGVPDDEPNHGYERWVSIPEDMEVPAPLVKKRLAGGIYAARVIRMGEWDDWMRLHAWVNASEAYDFRWGTVEGVCGWLEEHLNYWHWHDPAGTRQVDLMIPIEKRQGIVNSAGG